MDRCQFITVVSNNFLNLSMGTLYHYEKPFISDGFYNQRHLKSMAHTCKDNVLIGQLEYSLQMAVMN